MSSDLPAMIFIQRHFTSPTLPDPSATLSAQWRQQGILAQVRPGATVAITVGSRGISGIADGVRPLVR